MATLTNLECSENCYDQGIVVLIPIKILFRISLEIYFIFKTERSINTIRYQCNDSLHVDKTVSYLLSCNLIKKVDNKNDISVHHYVVVILCCSLGIELQL